MGADAPGLKTLDDALEIRRRMLLAFERAEREAIRAARSGSLTFVVVGGGPTGVELAGAIAEIARHTLAHEFRHRSTAQSRVVLIEAGPTILPRFREDLRDAARRSLERLGVEVRENTRVTVGRRSAASSLGDERLEAGTILWAAGVAASPLAPVARRAARSRRPRAGRTRPVTCRVTPSCTSSATGALARRGRATAPGVAQVAKQQARHAARNIGGASRGSRAAVPLPRSRDMATIGRAAAIAEAGTRPPVRLIGWLFWLFVHILKLIGFRNRLMVLIQWAWRIHDLPAQRAADHRARGGARARPADEVKMSGCCRDGNQETGTLHLFYDGRKSRRSEGRLGSLTPHNGPALALYGVAAQPLEVEQ